MNDEASEPEDLKWLDLGERAKYANHVELQYGPDDVKIKFGLRESRESVTHVATIILSTGLARRFSLLVADGLQKLDEQMKAAEVSP